MPNPVIVESRIARNAERPRLLALGVLLSGLTACGDGPLIACTDIFVYGVTVEVSDAVTGEPLEDATGTLRDGSFSEEMRRHPRGILQGAGERPGTYDIAVTAPGHIPWTRDDVEVDFDGCHVTRQRFQAILQPA